MLPTVDWLKEHCKKIHFFGLGFIQVKVSEFQRYHFYTDILPSIMPVEEIHNHRYTFRSAVLKGKVIQKLFFPARGSSHRVISVSCSPGEAEEVIRLVEPQMIFQTTHMTGSTYTIHKDLFHQVQSDFAITEIVRQYPSKERAEVIRKYGEPPVCPFSKTVPEERLWEVVDSMINNGGRCV